MMKLPTVINLNHYSPHGITVLKKSEDFLYIGRYFDDRRRKIWFTCSDWHNPYHVCRYRTPEDAVWLYREYLLVHPELLNQLPELSGKRLGCWCVKAPVSFVREKKVCHGEILLELFQLAFLGGI